MQPEQPRPDILEFLKQNELFDNIPLEQLREIALLAKEVHYEKGDILVYENEINDNILILTSGKVEVSKSLLKTDYAHRLITLGPQAIIGELHLVDQSPRSATVSALVPTTALVFSASKMKEIFHAKPRDFSRVMHKLIELEDEIKNYDKTPPFVATFMHNIAKHLSKRLRTTNEAMVETLHRELEHTQARVAMGALIITVIVVLSLYLFSFAFIESQLKHVATTTIISVPMIIVFAGIVFFGMKKTGYPMRTFGLTLKNWPNAVLESLVVTAGMIVMLVLIKWIIIHLYPFSPPKELFQGEFFTPRLPVEKDLMVMMAYICFVPLQEFVARGALQTSFQEFLIGRYKNVWALVLSNLLFATTHLHLSFHFALMVLIPGFVWGWLYFRERTLIGPIVSHQIFGAFAFFVLGF